VSKSPDNVARILSRFDRVDPAQQEISIRLDRKTARHYQLFWLHGFKGYRSPEAAGKG
jgi:hypothetical protein